jgi:hypothetical protein
MDIPLMKGSAVECGFSLLRRYAAVLRIHQSSSAQLEQPRYTSGSISYQKERLCELTAADRCIGELVDRIMYYLIRQT